jgi:hypothetical protein
LPPSRRYVVLDDMSDSGNVVTMFGPYAAK